MAMMCPGYVAILCTMSMDVIKLISFDCFTRRGRLGIGDATRTTTKTQRLGLPFSLCETNNNTVKKQKRVSRNRRLGWWPEGICWCCELGGIKLFVGGFVRFGTTSLSWLSRNVNEHRLCFRIRIVHNEGGFGVIHQLSYN